MAFNPNKHHRRSIRLKGYDYSKEGLYFITICVTNRLEIFGHIENDKMILNELGKLAKQEWLNTPIIRENISLGEFQLMPNHMHGIIQINFSKGNPEDTGKFKSPSETIGAIIRGFKGAATTKIKNLIREYRLNNKSGTGELQFAPKQFAPKQFDSINSIDLNKSIWQRDYFEIIIKDARAYQNISQYIINNPKKWNEDKFNPKQKKNSK